MAALLPMVTIRVSFLGSGKLEESYLSLQFSSASIPFNQMTIRRIASLFDESMQSAIAMDNETEAGCFKHFQFNLCPGNLKTMSDDMIGIFKQQGYDNVLYQEYFAIDWNGNLVKVR
jgi:hypothetical protein